MLLLELLNHSLSFHYFIGLYWLFIVLISVDLRDIREIRRNKNSKDFDKWPEETKKIDTSLCFVILYGKEFRLKTLSLAG